MVASENPAASEPEDTGELTLIRWMLSLSLEARLEVLQGFVDSVAELRGGSTGT